MNLVQFPARDIGDVSRGLRELADAIDRGAYDDAHHVAWVVNCGGGRIELGLLGTTSEPGAVGYHLMGCAMRRLDAV